MSKTRKILADILSGRSDANVAFADLCHLLERGGFIRVRAKAVTSSSTGRKSTKLSTCNPLETRRRLIKSNKCETSFSNTNWTST